MVTRTLPIFRPVSSLRPDPESSRTAMAVQRFEGKIRGEVLSDCRQTAWRAPFVKLPLERVMVCGSRVIARISRATDPRGAANRSRNALPAAGCL